MHSVWFRSTFLGVSKFSKIKEGVSNFWGEPILQNGWIIWSPLLYFNLKVSRTQILRHSLNFNAFCMIQEYFSPSFEICTKLKRGSHTYNKSYCCIRDDLFRTQVLHNSLDNIFYMIKSSYLLFSSFLKLLQIQERTQSPGMRGETNSTEQLNCFFGTLCVF